MNRIDELKMLHELSKPELKMAKENTKKHIKTTPMSPLTKRAMEGLVIVCEGYDSVIDELLAEIDRLKEEPTHD